MDRGEKPKRLRSFLVEDILGLDRKDSGSTEASEINRFSNLKQRESSSRAPNHYERCSNQVGNSSSDETEEKSVSDNMDWQG